jgi:16S rRNA (uracil1498-N3)-methyltransferase
VAPLLSQLQTSTEITIAIGPEGGWTEAEIEQAIAADFLPVSLGKRILRTITAPLVALAIINAYLDS